MTAEQARAVMSGYIAELNRVNDVPVRETGFEERVAGAWVFYWNSAEFLDTGKFEAQLVGQGPTLVMDDGTVHQGGSNERPIDVLARVQA
jgi:hypothetical protein